MTDDQLELLPEKPFKVVWTAVYSRHFHTEEEEFVSAREAYEFLKWGADDCTLYQQAIIKPNGTAINVDPFGPNQDVWISFEEFEKRIV
jgi:hypothetical protein